MKIIVNHTSSITTDAEGNMYVTRPNMYGKIVTYRLSTKEYSMLEVANWLHTRGKAVQDAFPNMSAEDREFLMTGITPEDWAKMFPKEGEDK